MLCFLDTVTGINKILPEVEKVKEKIVESEGRLSRWFNQFYNNTLDFAPRLAGALLMLFIGLWLVKRVAIFADKAMLRRHLEVSLRTFLKSLLSIGLKIILIVTVAGMLGIGTASFVTILGAAGLAVGLALQGSLSNFAGGVLILIFKPFKVGDSIEAGGQSGEVTEIQIFNTILLTGDHKTVILPNGPLSNGTIVNTTRYGTLRIDILLQVSNDNNIDKVQEIIMIVLNNNDRIIKHLDTKILIGKIANGAVNINVRPFCLPGDTAILTSELYHQLYDTFEKNSVKLPPAVKIIQAN
ncbi:MAG: mechanosensitive ion channel [Bacteroidetes bacterium]|nr:mechanosensitive ion channel [Bacteroidota bacterium]